MSDPGKDRLYAEIPKESVNTLAITLLAPLDEP
jgi:hypothetical protein